MEIILKPIGVVSNNRLQPDDDFWGNVISVIQLNSEFTAEALAGLNQFSHIEVLFYFHLVGNNEIITTAAVPREQPDKYPMLGVFAQRKKSRPNKIGATICKILEIKNNTITVQGLDAINGTPVLDIKPVLKQFLPESISQPLWVDDLMKNYWK